LIELKPYRIVKKLEIEMLRIFPFDKTGVSEAVAQFEENHDILLPEEYRTFLINYNGGNTLQTSFKIKKEVKE